MNCFTGCLPRQCMHTFSKFNNFGIALFIELNRTNKIQNFSLYSVFIIRSKKNCITLAVGKTNAREMHFKRFSYGSCTQKK